MLIKPTIFFRLRAALARHPNAIGAGSVAFSVIVLGFALAVLVQARQDATARAIENADNLARVIEHDITYTAELTDLSIQAAVDGAQDADVMRLPEHLRKEILFDRSATASQYIGSLLCLDSRGKIIVDSTSAVPRSVDLADRLWFTVHRDNPNLGLFISRPLHSRLNPDEVDLMFSRRVNHPDGSFAGVVVAAFRLDYFKNLLSGVRLGTGGAITLLQDDGHVILRYPNDETQVDEDFTGRKNFERFRQTHEMSFFGTSGRDGQERLYYFREFDKLKMIVIIAPSSRYVFADWTSRAWYIGIVTALLIVGLLFAAQLLSVEFRHRLEVEEHLRNMTRIDGLTGLTNRHSLDDRLMIEWLHSKRSGKPLALLFVDIDRFKNYNDTYGHQAGDDALTAVAQAIARNSQRQGDIAARFGGEEFVVVLPETDGAGAAVVAANIHSAVRALAIEHTGSEHGVITVSIGVACTDTEEVADALALIKVADQAVYRAKASGRNQTSTAEPYGDAAVTT
ncbi:diguanylate cyclase [Caballeronia sp. SEWSISQ10-4 2]|uniref:GGDEF domain-containing protein n=1 Tax=Caballeronia sp. SEWSISQ10-4 2 TaxID=2937438 RepID=UPI00264F787B|nr:GGDEF domain-containing protein [Caballeronia sp. SEWSISQ10-4 2]MDN7184009.1 diguanylate cyclase [Caballeronia sp. SEWSISQ10-4 2]